MAGFFIKLRSRFLFDRYSLVLFFRQFAVLSRAGFGTLRGIHTCLKQTSEPRLQSALADISNMIEKGRSYSEALESRKDIFSDFHVSMMRAAEASGKLPDILESLAQYEEKEMNLRYRLKSATTYPIFILIFSLLCVILLIRFLTPLLETITVILKGEIPLPTQVLMYLSWLMSHPLFYVAAFLFLGAFHFLYKYYRGTMRGRMNIDSLMFKIPVYGVLYKKTVLIRVCRVLTALLESGVPAYAAIDLASEVSGNFYFQDRIMGEVSYMIKEGQEVGKSFELAEFFPPMMVSMIKVGEQSGTLPDVMAKLSKMYDFDVEIAVSSFYAALEPILIVFMGLLTFLILLAAFLPIYNVVGGLTS